MTKENFIPWPEAGTLVPTEAALAHAGAVCCETPDILLPPSRERGPWTTRCQSCGKQVSLMAVRVLAPKGEVLWNEPIWAHIANNSSEDDTGYQIRRHALAQSGAPPGSTVEWVPFSALPRS